MMSEPIIEERCSFCERPSRNLVLSKDGKSICVRCVAHVSKILHNKSYRYACKTCGTVLEYIVEDIWLDKVQFVWEQDKNGSLTLVGIKTHDVRNREFFCPECDNLVDIRLDALLEKEIGYALNTSICFVNKISYLLDKYFIGDRKLKDKDAFIEELHSLYLEERYGDIEIDV